MIVLFRMLISVILKSGLTSLNPYILSGLTPLAREMHYYTLITVLVYHLSKNST